MRPRSQPPLTRIPKAKIAMCVGLLGEKQRDLYKRQPNLGKETADVDRHTSDFGSEAHHAKQSKKSGPNNSQDDGRDSHKKNPQEFRGTS